MIASVTGEGAFRWCLSDGLPHDERQHAIDEKLDAYQEVRDKVGRTAEFPFILCPAASHYADVGQLEIIGRLSLVAATAINGQSLKALAEQTLQDGDIQFDHIRIGYRTRIGMLGQHFAD
ncbi:hypothetical protein Efla_005963 [Eimeria flavescens]